jgi:hypothetical protein
MLSPSSVANFDQVEGMRGIPLRIDLAQWQQHLPDRFHDPNA